ncbi:MAG: hypothetical protein U1F43_06055 [Myxococcota bacterium]
MDAVAPYTAEDKQRWKQKCLAKGQEISTKLEEILAGKEVDLQKIGLVKDDEPALTPEKRLRRFLDQVMQRMRSLDDPRFGYDRSRRAFLSVAELDEVPWIDLG